MDMQTRIEPAGVRSNGAHTKVVTTACGMCYNGCGVKVHVQNDVVVGIEGNPDNPQNRGNMCAKGKAGFMNLYNPHRVRAPMKRTNPDKGVDVDPGWQEISWQEAIDTVVAQFERIRDNPKKLWIQCWEPMGDSMFWMGALGNAFGTPHNNITGSPTCGKVVHPVEFLTGGGFHQQPDLHYANYCVLIGTQFGYAARGSTNHHNLDMAEARERGMKLVVVDPVCAYAASKANEWIPIRPGTDAALGLSMLHVLLNEVQIYDAPFLKQRTNAPYLVGEDGRYVRDTASGEPLVFDAADGRVKPYNDATLSDPALDGKHSANGKPCVPAFVLLREHLHKYTPEQTEEITTIPAATVRRIAREFGEAACIGQTITIDGVELPYRPVVVDWARGTQGHKHGFHNCWPLKLLNVMVGAVNVPGGIMSTGAAGEFPHEWWPEGGPDGMLAHGGHIIPAPFPSAFPGRTPTPPVRADIGELFPLAPHHHVLHAVVSENPAKFGLTEKDMIEMFFHVPVNTIMSSFGDTAKVERFFKKLRFMVGFAVEINETNQFDDILLPWPSYLERFDFVTGMGSYLIGPCGQDDFHWQVRQPVVPVPPGIRQPQEVIQEIAQRLGVLPGVFRIINHYYRLEGHHELKPTQRYDAADVIDRSARAWFGEERGLEWFRENAQVRHPTSVQAAYIGPKLDARMPIYLEHFLARRDELKTVLEKLKLDWDLSDYVPLSEYLPCPSYEALKAGTHDLIAVHFKVPFNYGTYNSENPWLNEINEQTDAYSILLNEDVGKAKGLRSGDEVWLESPVRKARARVKLTQCIHPEVVGVGGHFGHWAREMPISRGKGVNFNSLCPTDLEHIDAISGALDHCVQVKVYK